MIEATHVAVRTGKVSMDGHVVYAIFDEYGRCAYVGSTKNIQVRFRSHLNQSIKRGVSVLFRIGTNNYPVHLYKPSEVFDRFGNEYIKKTSALATYGSTWTWMYRYPYFDLPFFGNTEWALDVGLAAVDPDYAAQKRLEWSALEKSLKSACVYPLTEKESALMAENVLFYCLDPYINTRPPLVSADVVEAYWIRDKKGTQP